MGESEGPQRSLLVRKVHPYLLYNKAPAVQTSLIHDTRRLHLNLLQVQPCECNTPLTRRSQLSS
jgi:hypothetical protein